VEGTDCHCCGVAGGVVYADGGYPWKLAWDKGGGTVESYGGEGYVCGTACETDLVLDARKDGRVRRLVRDL
jgi:hypothetical protein